MVAKYLSTFTVNGAVLLKLSFRLDKLFWYPKKNPIYISRVYVILFFNNLFNNQYFFIYLSLLSSPAFI